MQNTTSCVQVYFIEKYMVAQSPKRDYYALRVSNNQLTLMTWKITHGPHRFPMERKISHQDFITNSSFQDEIFRTFGEDTFRQVLEVTLGEKDYLQRLPPGLLRHILINLDFKDVMSLSQASKLSREAVKNTIPLLDIHQKSFSNMKIKKLLLGLRKPSKSASILPNTTDYITKCDNNWNKFDGKKSTLDTSLSKNNSRPSSSISLNKAGNSIMPMKTNANTNTLVVNSSPKVTLSRLGNVRYMPKFDTLTSALLAIDTISANNKTIVKNDYIKQSKKCYEVKEKDKETDTSKSNNKAKLNMNSLSKMFEVSSVIPEHYLDKSRSELQVSKSLLYKCVEKDPNHLMLQSSDAECASSFKSKIAPLKNNKRSTKNMTSKATKGEVQTSGSGDGVKRTSLNHSTHDSKSEIKQKSIVSSKKPRNQDHNQTVKLKERGVLTHTICKKISRK